MRLRLNACLSYSICLFTLYAITNSSIVMALVNSDGSYSTSIPIVVPEGFGPKPKLSLQYNSNLGNDMLGVGWQLKGLDRIYRSHYNNGTTTHDGKIEFDGTDSYTSSSFGILLDSGMGYYHSKKERFIKFIPSADLCGDGPCTWTAIYPDGTKYFYGTNPDSQSKTLTTPANIFIWHLSRVEDIHGRYYSVIYSQLANNVSYPTEILYSQLQGKSSYTIRFDFWDTRFDSPADYSLGTVLVPIFRLNQIRIMETSTTTVNDKLLSKYEFNYRKDPSKMTSRSLLESIQQFGYKEGVVTERPKTIFEWSDVSASTSTADKYIYGNYLKGKDDTFVLGSIDINGDGKEEPLLFHHGTSHFGLYAIFNPLKSYRRSEQLVSVNVFLDPSAWRTTMDVNGDSKVDFVYSINGKLYALLNNGAGFDSPIVWTTIPEGHILLGAIDVDGDGRKDIAYIQPTPTPPLNGITKSDIIGIAFNRGKEGRESTVEHNLNWRELPVQLKDFTPQRSEFNVIDINNDGLSDLIYYGHILITNSQESHYVGRLKEMRIADLTGDGMQDIAYIDATTKRIFVLINTGDNSFSKLDMRKGPPENIDNHPSFELNDVNGDGVKNIIYPVNVVFQTGGGSDAGKADFDYNYLHILSSATIFDRLWVNVNQSEHHPTRRMIGDYDGDGKAELFYAKKHAYHGGSSFELWQDLYIAEDPFQSTVTDKIVSISNGLGQQTVIDYKPVSDHYEAILGSHMCPAKANVQTYAGWCGFPHRSMRDLVKSTFVSDGMPNSSVIETRYQYRDGRIFPGIRSERAFLGFASISKTNMANSTFKLQTFNWLKPHEGRVASIKYMAQQSVGVDVWRVTSSKSFVYGEETSWLGEPFSILNSTTEEIHDVNNNNKGKIITTYSWNQYGNIVSKCVDNENKSTILTEVNTCVTREFDNDVANWIVNRLGSESTVRGVGVPMSPSIDVLDKYASRRFEYVNNRVDKQCDWINTDNSEACTSFGYYPEGQLHTITDARNNKTTFTYDPVFGAYNFEYINALKHKTTQRVDSWGEVVEYTDTNTQTTNIVRDGLGRITHINYADGAWIRKQYLNYGALIDNNYSNRQHIITERSIDQTRVYTRKDYMDGLGFTYRTVTSGDSGKLIEVYREKDPTGRLYRTSMPSYIVIDTADEKPTRWAETYTYKFGRRSSIMYADGTFSYFSSPVTTDPNNLNYPNAIVHENALGEKTKNIFNMKKQLVAVVDASGKYTFYEYDPLGNPKSVKNTIAGEIATEYDSLGRLVSSTDVDRGYYSLIYDKVGNLEKVMAPGNMEVGYTYDALNRVSVKSVSGQAGILHLYDQTDVINGVGRLSKVYDSFYATYKINEYDSMGRIKDITRILDSNPYNLKYDYDLLGNKVQSTLPNGSIIERNYSTGGNLVDVKLDGKVYASWFDFTEVGLPKSMAYGNGVITDYLYNARNRLYDINVTQGATVYNWNYGLNDIGMLDSKTEFGITEIYGYDSLHRLETVEKLGVLSDYKYDNRGNLYFKNDITMAHTEHRLESATVGPTEYRYKYDSAGNQTVKDTYVDGINVQRLTTNYSGEGKALSHVIKDPRLPSGYYTPGSKSSQHFYNHQGRRYKTTHVDESRRTLYTYYISPEYEVRVDVDKNAIQSTIQLTGYSDIASISSNWIDRGTKSVIPNDKGDTPGTYYFHKDRLGSLSIITDNSGQTTNIISYSPFGSSSSMEPISIPESFNKFTGQSYEDEFGIYHYGARYYDPVVGLFTTPDPIIFDRRNPLAYNSYSYVSNNPVNFTDPTGLTQHEDVDRIDLEPIEIRLGDENPQVDTFPPWDDADLLIDIDVLKDISEIHQDQTIMEDVRAPINEVSIEKIDSVERSTDPCRGTTYCGHHGINGPQGVNSPVDLKPKRWLEWEKTLSNTIGWYGTILSLASEEMGMIGNVVGTVEKFVTASRTGKGEDMHRLLVGEPLNYLPKVYGKIGTSILIERDNLQIFKHEPLAPDPVSPFIRLMILARPMWKFED